VQDIVEANMRAMHSTRASGKVFNVSSGVATTLLSLRSAIIGLVGTDIPPHFLPPRHGDIVHSVADIGYAQSELGYEPRVSLIDGLRETIAFYTP
jgi:UDP-glucose 4-epimerase